MTVHFVPTLNEEGNLALVLQGCVRASESLGRPHAAQLAAPEDVILTMDVDNTHPASLIAPMAQAVEGGKDLVIASRFRPGAHVVEPGGFRRAVTIASSFLYRSMFPIDWFW
jgi:hypothetical protein